MTDERRPTLAVSAVVRRGRDLLVVRRAREPSQGRWAIPGGRVEHAERVRDALVREVAEETGLAVGVGEWVGWDERLPAAPGDDHFVILCFRAEVLGGGVAVAGDDVDAVRWVDTGRVGDLDLVEGLLHFLTYTGSLRTP